jgi:hypothetical protein
MKVDPNKKYKTRDGLIVSDLHINRLNIAFPVRGMVSGTFECWTENGKYWSHNECSGFILSR